MSNLGESPARGCAVRPRSDLNDFTPNAMPGLLLKMTGNRIEPADEPSMYHRLPYSKCSAVHVVNFAGFRRTLGNARHDPNVLNRSPFQHPGCVYFAGEPKIRN